MEAGSQGPMHCDSEVAPDSTIDTSFARKPRTKEPYIVLPLAAILVSSSVGLLCFFGTKITQDSSSGDQKVSPQDVRDPKLARYGYLTPPII